MTERRLPFPAPSRLAALALLGAAAILGSSVTFAAEPYKLTAADLKLDCKQLTGTIKVRLTALRQKPIAPTSAMSRGLQSAAAPIVGGTSYGIDETAQRAADMRLIEAYNKRLVEKNCRSFDLAAALAAGASSSAGPTIPARKAEESKTDASKSGAKK